MSDSGLIARALALYRLRLRASPSYLANQSAIIYPHDLAQHECLGFSHTELRTRWRFEDKKGEVISVSVAGKLMVDSGEALLMAARAEMGILLQPCELVSDELSSGRLVEVLADFPVAARPFHLLHAPDRRMTPKLSSFIDFAIATFSVDAQSKMTI